MHRIFRKDQVLTIPNLLSVIRLALIPLIVWLYIGKQEYSAAVAVILISGATDIIDGFIARKFNMVSDLGKILDPVADKLTQATVILCLTVKYRWMRGLIVLFVVADTQKEIDQKVVETVKKQHEKARRLLADNRKKLDELASYLYEKETITGSEFMTILNRKDGNAV